MAEGVETTDQLDWLRDEGRHQMQSSRMGHRCLMLDVAKLRRLVAVFLIIQ